MKLKCQCPYIKLRWHTATRPGVCLACDCYGTAGSCAHHWPTEPKTFTAWPLMEKVCRPWCRGTNGGGTRSPDKGPNPGSANAWPQGRDFWGLMLLTCRAGLPTEPPVIKTTGPAPGSQDSMSRAGLNIFIRISGRTGGERVINGRNETENASQCYAPLYMLSVNTGGSAYAFLEGCHDSHRTSTFYLENSRTVTDSCVSSRRKKVPILCYTL